MNIKQKITYARQFGSFFALKSFYYQQIINLSEDDKKIRFADKLNEYKMEKLQVEFGEYIKQRAKKWKDDYREIKQNRIVWVFWWQGNYDEIPMVKMCLNSIENNLPKNSKMIIVSKENLGEYLKLHPQIMKKVDNGTISLTHLSDIVRFNLLSEWGGCWFDATIYALRPYPYIFENEMWTTKRNDNNIYIPKGRWTGFAMGGYSHNILFDLMKDLFEEYWCRYDVLIDFFLIDLFIELLYRNIPEIKELIDKVPYNNTEVQKLWTILSEEYNEQNFKNLTKNTDLYKLSWRIKVESMKKERCTIYGKLSSKYKEA